MSKLSLVFCFIFILIPILGFQLFTLPYCESTISGTSKRSRDLHCRCKTLALYSVFSHASLPAVIVWRKWLIPLKPIMTLRRSQYIYCNPCCFQSLSACTLMEGTYCLLSSAFNGKGLCYELMCQELAHRSLKYTSRAQVC